MEHNEIIRDKRQRGGAEMTRFLLTQTDGRLMPERSVRMVGKTSSPKRHNGRWLVMDEKDRVSTIDQIKVNLVYEQAHL